MQSLLTSSRTSCLPSPRRGKDDHEHLWRRLRQRRQKRGNHVEDLVRRSSSTSSSSPRVRAPRVALETQYGASQAHASRQPTPATAEKRSGCLGKRDARRVGKEKANRYSKQAARQIQCAGAGTRFIPRAKHVATGSAPVSRSARAHGFSLAESPRVAQNSSSTRINHHNSTQDGPAGTAVHQTNTTTTERGISVDVCGSSGSSKSRRKSSASRGLCATTVSDKCAFLVSPRNGKGHRWTSEPAGEGRKEGRGWVSVREGCDTAGRRQRVVDEAAHDADDAGGTRRPP